MNIDLSTVTHTMPSVTPREARSARAGRTSPMNSSRRNGSGGDIRSVLVRKTECIRIEGSFNQTAQDTISRILQNASACGFDTVRVQTIRLTKDYSYSYNHKEGEPDVFQVRDTHSLVIIPGLRMRVHLASRPRELVDWLRQQELDVLITGRLVNPSTSAGEPSLADFLNVVAVYVPFKRSLQMQGPQTIGSYYNAQYTEKTLEATAAKSWFERLSLATSAGGTKSILGVLYIGRDFGIPAQGGGGDDDDALLCKDVRQHLTWAKVEPDPGWVLRGRLLSLITWIHRLGFSWSLIVPLPHKEPKWAQLVVLLEPLDTYYSL